MIFHITQPPFKWILLGGPLRNSDLLRINAIDVLVREINLTQITRIKDTDYAESKKECLIFRRFVDLLSYLS
jgi:hypothetical protein